MRPKLVHTVSVWAGWSSEGRPDGAFVDVNSGIVTLEENGYSPFIPGQPNGRTMEQCVEVSFISLQLYKIHFSFESHFNFESRFLRAIS